MQYYSKYHDYRKIDCSKTCTSVKCLHLIFTILVAVVLLSDIMIISITMIIILTIYHDMKFLLLPIPSCQLTHLLYTNLCCHALYQVAQLPHIMHIKYFQVLTSTFKYFKYNKYIT